MKIAAAAIFTAFSSLLVACGGNAPPAATSPAGGSLLTLTNTPAGHQELIAALQKTGHQCEERGRAVICDKKKERSFTFAVAFADAPHRVVFVVPSAMKIPCEEASPRFNTLNHEFDTVTLTCEGNDFAAAGVLVVPKSGVTESDLTSYVDPWLLQLATIIQANHLEEIVK